MELYSGLGQGEGPVVGGGGGGIMIGSAVELEPGGQRRGCDGIIRTIHS